MVIHIFRVSITVLMMLVLGGASSGVSWLWMRVTLVLAVFVIGFAVGGVGRER